MAAADIIIGSRFTRWTVSSLPFKIKSRQVVYAHDFTAESMELTEWLGGKSDG